MSTPTKRPPDFGDVGGATPVPRSLLKTGAGPALRVEREQPPPAPSSAFKFASHGLDHFSLFEKVQTLEKDVQLLRQTVRELRSEKEELVERLQAAQDMLDGVTSRHDQATAADSNEEQLLQQVAQGDLRAQVQLLQIQLAAEQTERRKAHNQLVDLRGSVRVYARVRPRADGCADSSDTAVLPAADTRSLTTRVNGSLHSFEFDRVFGPTASQPQLYAEVNELVQSTLDGFSVCIFSYGQTGSGKTYSMMGDGTGDGRGLVPRAIERMLSHTERLGLQDWTFDVKVSVLEIYNERVRDLLNPRLETADINAIRHDAGGHATVAGAKAERVESVQQALQLISSATAHRACHATAMNATSSRSHCVFMFMVTGRHTRSGTTLTGSLSMVDLAGSERLARSRAEGTRKLEACAINASLSCLADVFEALGSRARHVPYRNSKLTYLLKPSLSPGGKALMLVHVAPEAESAYEALTSLRFAAKVSGVETGPATRRVEAPRDLPVVASSDVHLGAVRTRARAAAHQPSSPGRTVGAATGTAGAQRALRVGRKRERTDAAPASNALLGSSLGSGKAALAGGAKRKRTWH